MANAPKRKRKHVYVYAIIRCEAGAGPKTPPERRFTVEKIVMDLHHAEQEVERFNARGQRNGCYYECQLARFEDVPAAAARGWPNFGAGMQRATRRTPLGRHIVADPSICHGKPTFIGTRVMVWQVLDAVADEMEWEDIVAQWPGSFPKAAIAEAAKLARRSFVLHAVEDAVGK